MTPRSTLARFVPAYALANMGAFAAFAPVLALLLPVRAELIAGADGKLVLLSEVLLAGAIMASLANIGAGALADRVLARTGSRLPLIAVGLIATLASYALLPLAETGFTLIAAVLVWQVAFNLLFAPLLAMLADYVPDNAKGRVAGLLNFGLPGGYLMTAFLTLPMFMGSQGLRLTVLALIVTLCFVPLFWISRGGLPLIVAGPEGATITVVGGERARIRKALGWIWGARLAVQLTGAVITNFLLFLVQDRGGMGSAADTTPWTAESAMGALIAIGVGVSVTIGLVVGAASDRSGQRMSFMRIGAVGVTLVMAAWWLWPGWWPVAIGYPVLLGVMAMFLTTESAFVAELLRTAPDRARVLGVMNLTNTLPAIIVPVVVLVMDAIGAGLGGVIGFCALGGVTAYGCLFMLGRSRV